MPQTTEEGWFGRRLTPAQKAAVLYAVERELRQEKVPVEAKPGSFLEAAARRLECATCASALFCRKTPR